MRTCIYEYSDGSGNSRFWDSLVKDEGGRGCWELEVDVPDSLNPYISNFDVVCFKPKNGFPTRLGEALISNKGNPCIECADEDGNIKYYALEVLSRKERSTAMYF